MDVIPRNVNPVSVQSSGKKHVILDLRFINKHLWKQSIKFEDLRVALNYLEKGHFMFSCPNFFSSPVLPGVLLVLQG